ncbi:hypothetical protein AVEN_230253-1 [Araneus ventricosus]|uniref:Uncharacterized protein n=1 Tax=Araneus ventricosus TaxID=182803 RepID=A0A4Y2NCX6_ARAVE|nr:hypothetical protein AVEN_230253-1 [Araneus ventricosus]
MRTVAKEQTHFEPLIIASQSPFEEGVVFGRASEYVLACALHLSREVEVGWWGTTSYIQTRPNVNCESLCVRRKPDRIWFAASGT